mmetsp:Transcript_40259/g.41069  ORF Transcript_40259/g.41069 Transcript_40259/m.41069 type:complete len:297 (-) Transcript_40259:328-1218(-)|eukprot:CAMPEP_0182417984 /NCGR_PEP_ID=MMETSP1167-20130531/2441_1 /TAXON_ID=2988 /ORGANISM="Mallomonas Sp, Strain CCMP3275" /LENGTH=296 /DNA_ID=CAMNT_0024591917 /DNA_START=131 /DNA_END=1021 /DNA_ORIENTATION=+
MSNSWKLVEAEPITPAKPVNDNSSNSKQENWNKNRRGPSTGGRGGNRRNFNNRRDNNNRGRRYQDDAYYGGIYIPDTPESRSYYARVVVYNIEMLFNVENLCRDTFLRSYMDEAGYIPIPFICNYVTIFGANYPDIVNMLRESSTLEVDIENETVRLKENWQMWLMPNGEGGMGLPLYVKQPLPPMADPMGEYYYDYQTGVYYDAQQQNVWYDEQGEGEVYTEENNDPNLPNEDVQVDLDGNPLPPPPDNSENISSETPDTVSGLENLTNDIGEVLEESVNKPQSLDSVAEGRVGN